MSDDTVGFDGPWCTSKETCELCGYVQVSVYPIICKWLECANCRHMNLAPQLDPAGEQTRDDWRAIEDLTR